MKRYTREQALEEIFNQKNLTATMRVLKHRYYHGGLSTKTVDSLLDVNGYAPTRQILYTKKK